MGREISEKHVIQVNVPTTVKCYALVLKQWAHVICFIVAITLTYSTFISPISLSILNRFYYNFAETIFYCPAKYSKNVKDHKISNYEAFL